MTPQTEIEKDRRRWFALNAWCGHNYRFDECWVPVLLRLQEMEQDLRPAWVRALELDAPDYQYRRGT